MYDEEEIEIISSSSEEEGEEEDDEFPSPAPAAIDRSRATPKNPSVKAKAVRGKSTLKRKSVLIRVTEFPGQSLECRDGRLFCGCCREFISEKKSSVKRHIKGTAKHANALKKSKLEGLRQQSLSQAIKGEVKAKIKISPVVVFGVLSRMVLVRES